MDILSQIFLIIFLILVNGLFACTEIAIISVNKNKLTQLIEKNNKSAIVLKQLIDSPSKMLSTIQVAITLSGFFASASAAVTISQELSKFMPANVALVLVTLMLSYLSLVFGELIPKRIGLIKSMEVALFVAKFINFISILFTPIIWVLTMSTNLCLKLLGFDTKNIEEKMSREELLTLVSQGQLNTSEKEYIENVIEFNDISAKEIMIPRPSIFALSKDETVEDILKIKNITRYSRVPIFENDLDNIIGILHIKDLLLIEDNKVTLESLVKDVLFVPDTKKIDVLFKEMKSTNNHLVILIDEYGGVSGLVTLEDILEELVGDITDEYDSKVYDITQLSPNKFIVNGELSINDLNDFLETNFVSEHYETIAGLIIEKTGLVPNNTKKQEIKIDNFVFRVQKVENKKIQKVLIFREGSEK